MLPNAVPQPVLRVEVFRDLTDSRLAAGVQKPWIAYCPCCLRSPGYGFGATFPEWRCAIDWAIQHAHTTHAHPRADNTIRYSTPEVPS